MAIIVVSDDTAEVIATCDSAIVMHDGRITGVLENEDLTEAKLAEAAI